MLYGDGWFSTWHIQFPLVPLFVIVIPEILIAISKAYFSLVLVLIMASNSAQVDISQGEKELGVFIQYCQNYHEIVHQMFAGWRMKTDWCLGPVYDPPTPSICCVL